MSAHDIVMAAAGASGPPAVWTNAIPYNAAASTSYGGYYSSSIGKFVLGSGTSIYTTTDYQNYTLVASGLASIVSYITYTGSLYVAVGPSGAIQTSPDLVTWTSRTSGSAANFYKVIWNGSILVATGSGGAIVTSPDGLTWTSQTSGLATNMFGIAWNGSIFLAIGGGTQGATSPDGVTWTVVTLTGQTVANRVTWTGSLFVLVGSSGVITTSPNGTTWTTRTSPTTNSLVGVENIGSTVFAIGTTATVVSSSDGGVTWATTSVGASNQSFTGMSKTNDRFVYWGSTSNCFYTFDGVTNYVSHLPNAGIPTGSTIGYNPSSGTYGIGFYGFAAYSTDRLHWKSSYIGSTNTQQQVTCCYVSALSLWFLGTNTGVLRTSPDFVTWTVQTIAGAPSTSLRGFAWNGTTLVGSFSGSGILTSTNGSTWTYTANTAAGVSPIWTGTQFVIIGSATGNILTSPDGTTWTTRAAVYTGGALQAIAWTGSLIVGVGLTGNIVTSPDGITWTTRTSGTATATFNAVDATGSTVWAVGIDTNGVVYKSTDGGITWANDTTIPASVGTGQLLCVKCGSGTDVVVGGRGAGSTQGRIFYR